MLKITYFTVGMYETNCYVVWDEDTKNAVVIDPGDQCDDIQAILENEGLTAGLILLTHGHFDHSGAVNALQAATGAQVWLNKKDLEPDQSKGLLDPAGDYHFYDEGDTVTLDSMTFHVLSTPGHTPGSVCLVMDQAIFAGDTLFSGSCGRTDFEGGSWEDMERSLVRLSQLEGNYSVFPGHMEMTTLDRERQVNAFMRQAVADLEGK